MPLVKQTRTETDEGGSVAITEFWWEDPEECPGCGEERYLHHAVPWYYEPVAEGDNDGGYMTVCKACHDKWWRKDHE